MSKPLKVLAIIGSVIIVLVIGLIIVAKVVITPERVRATVIPIAEENLNRKVDFTGLDVSIFSGITLKGFTIFEDDGKERFIALEGLVMSYRLLPLLTGKVVVDEILLDQPRILVVRNGDGTFNFDSLVKTDEQEPEPSAEKEPAAEDGAGMDLLVASVRVHAGEVLYRDFALRPNKPFELSVTNIGVVAKDISLEKSFPVEIKAELAGAPMNVQAQVDPVQSSGSANLNLNGLAVNTFSALVGEGYPAHLEPLTLDLALRGSGSAKQASLNGDVNIGLKGQKVMIKLDAPGLLKMPLPLVVDISAQELLIDKLLPPEQESSKAAEGGKESKGQPSADEAGPLDIPVDAKGSVKISKLGYTTLNLDQVVLDWTLAKNVFNLDRLNANAAGGTIDGRAQVNLARKGFGYQGGLAVKKVQADPVVSAFYPDYRGVVTGGLDFNLDARGHGTQVETIKRSLSGEGNVLIHEGRVSGAPLVEGLAAFLGEDELKVLSFRETQGSFTIKDGKIDFTSSIDGSQARMQPHGSVGLDGSLDVRLETRLNPELTRKVAGKGDFAGAFKDDEGWGLFPLRVKGKVDKPRFTLDSKAVKKQVEQKVKDQAVEELSRKLFKGDENEQSGEKVLKDALKGLLGN